MLNKKIARLVLGCMLGLGAVTGFAQQNAETRDYLSLDYNHVFRDSNRASEDGNGGSLGYGLALSKLWGLEFSGFYNDYDRNVFRSTDWREYGAKVDGMFFYSRDPGFSPYWALGVGAIRSDERVSNQSSTDPFWDIGLGFMRYFSIGSQDFAVRADARFRWLDTSGIASVGSNGEPVIKVGLVLPFGARETGTALPVAAKPAATVPSADAEAPPTAAEEARARVFEPVHFDYNKSSLTPKSRQLLDGAATSIKEMAKESPVKVKLNGHTDNIGSDGYNQGLSERRAESVAEYLQGKGVDGKAISTRAYGKTLPDRDNATEEGRAYNRRVEIKVIPQ